METNNLKFTKTVIKSNREQLVIKVELNDECKNGHQDFAITGDLYQGASRLDRHWISGGCLHKEIAKYAPEFKPFIALHLCDFNGVPMYVIANGFYHMNNGFNDKSKDHKSYFCDYYRVTPAQYDELKKAKDQNYFGFLLVSLGIVENWKIEAQAAIKLLENLTGDTFLNDSKKDQLIFAESLEETQKKVNDGYYTDLEIEKREIKKASDKKSKMLADIKDSRDKKILEANCDFELQKILIELFLTKSNVIFYKHTNTISFNWQNSVYEKTYSQSEFDQFVEVAERNKLLKDCKFEIKTK